MSTVDRNDQSRAVEIVRGEASFRVSRSSGPGGQHAQKNETRVEAYLEIDSSSLSEDAKKCLRRRYRRTVRAISQDERSQLRNRELALERLLEKVHVALEPEVARISTRPSRRAILNRGTAKRHHSFVKRLRRRPDDED